MACTEAWKVPYIFRFDCYVSKNLRHFTHVHPPLVCTFAIILLLGTVISCAGPDRCLESETFTLTCTRSLDTTLLSRIRIMSEDGTAMG